MSWPNDALIMGRNWGNAMPDYSETKRVYELERAILEKAEARHRKAPTNTGAKELYERQLKAFENIDKAWTRVSHLHEPPKRPPAKASTKAKGE